eukprot:gene16604-8031_t
MEGKENDRLDFNTYFPKVLLFGDSLTQRGFHDGGWAIKLMEYFERKCDFLNRGFSGYTSRMCRVILPNLLHRDGHKNESLYAATILIGTNDAVLEDKDDRAVPLDEYKDNVKYIISKIESYGVPRERIILVTPPPMDIAAWTGYAREKDFAVAFSEEKLAPYVNACLTIADEMNMRRVNLWEDMLKKEDWREFFNDGLHFNNKGHMFVFQELKEHFDVVLSPLKIVYPEWKDVDHINPKKDLLV